MQSRLAQFFNTHIGAKSSLVKAIVEDGYKNWEQHFDRYNNTAKTKADPLQMLALGMDVYEHNLKDALSNLRITDEKRDRLTAIQRFFGLPDAEVETLKKKYGLKAVDLLVQYRLQDKALDKAERHELQLLGKELSLAPAEIEDITNRNVLKIYEAEVRQFIEDGRLDSSEQQALYQLAVRLGLNPDAVRIDPQLEERLRYLQLLNELDNGYLPQVPNVSIVLQKAEVAHWQASTQLLVSKTVTTGYTGRSSGVSIRVMKGVSYRIGSSRSTPIREQITQKFPGTLVVTNKRVVFNGTGKSFSIPFSQMLSFDPYSDGIGIQKTNGTGHLLQFPNLQVSEVTFKVLQNALNAFFT